MTDFLTRLAERTLMTSDVARPVTAPMFAPARARASGEVSEIRDEEEAGSMDGLLEIREASARDLAPPSARPPRATGDTQFDLTPDSMTDSLPDSLFGTGHDSRHSRQRGASRDEARASSFGGATLRGEGEIPLPESRARDDAGRESRAEGREDFTRRARHSGPVSPRTVSASRGEPGIASNRDPAGAVRPREIYPAEKGENAREAAREDRQEKASPAPIIKVSIGRVEVRALGRQTPPAPRAKPSQPGPALTLDQYLKQRDEGKR